LQIIFGSILTFIIRTQILCCTTTDLGIFLVLFFGFAFVRDLAVTDPWFV